MIQDRTINLIAGAVSENSTWDELVTIFKTAKVPENVIQLAGIASDSKRKLVKSVINQLLKSPDKKVSDVIFSLIPQFAHPLTFAGDTELSREAIKLFNQWLTYDGYELSGFGNFISMGKARTAQQVKEDDERFEEQIAEDQGIALSTINSKYLDELAIIKNGYQLLVNIVESYFENTANPDIYLNNAFVKIFNLVYKANSKIFEALRKEDIWIVIPGENIYRPFRNLFGAEEEVQNLSNPAIQVIIKRKMNKYLGEILELCASCDSSDIIGDSSTQEYFNEVSLHLSKLKEHQQSESNKATSTEKSKNQAKEPKTTVEKSINEPDVVIGTSIGLSGLEVKFNDQEAAIVIGNFKCQLPPFKNEHYFGRALFKHKANHPIDWSEIYEKITGDHQRYYGKPPKIREHWRPVYDTMVRINKRVREKLNTNDDLFSWQEMTVKRNF